MKITKLQFENFRNYENYSYVFPSDKNLIVLTGENGKGKTNFLEGIYMLSLGRSFRNSKLESLVKWECPHMRCTGEIEDDENEKHILEVFYSSSPKRKNLKKNDVNMKNSDYIGNFTTVLFHPEDLNMLYLSPSLRRKYMDIILSQSDKRYLHALMQYRKLIKQRSALLKEIHEIQRGRNIGDEKSLNSALDAWDKQLPEYGSEIIKKRLKFIESLNGKATEIYQDISKGDEVVEVKYVSRIKEISEYANMLLDRRYKDIRDEKTSIGPHIDDIKFLINGIDLVEFASRGEVRTLLLAVKISEIEYLRERTKKHPVLLLDDVFSELDFGRQTHLLNAISGCQAIITTTDVEKLEKLAKSKADIEFVEMA
ncbi:DNA replication/repair protein RecF [Candidatus Peregrinibacteria bacterium CG_4_10_14_0_2_um_filter_38_24]|nr:MAG: DNA replication/repair protein RecF [Candidatus Peregrinibacteria bacterium CG_4_10_14_0_2_um_filter_38_24]PJC38928.1 MAG: DNA replication/repair protein RecF [Candidatus Peregrinibacteria bacterium CG_4_9_14_0_2_um_filter_38_9]